ncbi:hypothetical protein ACHAW5_010841 [Stephanodiscus triporus]|uniref:Cation/H+ exchanger transmembrane domain-containing protein n=1 Tax=Stephanodiscus triporus TaxID=2934178 RepID=A0ABD3Q9S1_9STRA
MLRSRSRRTNNNTDHHRDDSSSKDNNDRGGGGDNDNNNNDNDDGIIIPPTNRARRRRNMRSRSGVGVGVGIGIGIGFGGGGESLDAEEDDENDDNDEIDVDADLRSLLSGGSSSSAAAASGVGRSTTYSGITHLAPSSSSLDDRRRRQAAARGAASSAGGTGDSSTAVVPVAAVANGDEGGGHVACRCRGGRFRGGKAWPLSLLVVVVAVLLLLAWEMTAGPSGGAATFLLGDGRRGRWDEREGGGGGGSVRRQPPSSATAVGGKKFPRGRAEGGKDGGTAGSAFLPPPPAAEKRGKKRAEEEGDDNGGRNWGIMEAIQNIDRVFMDSRPPRPGVVVVVDDDANANDAAAGRDGRRDETDEEVPVVRGDDDALPANADALDAYAYALPASDALECRSSVIAFVINATDVKDECDGLRRAFDKACSVQQETRENTMDDSDEIGSEGDYRVDESSSSSAVVVAAHPQKQEKAEGPLISLNIPTANKHVSEGMLNDALLLQRTDVESLHSSLDTPPPQKGAREDGRRPGVDDDGGGDALTTAAAANGPNITAAAAAAVKDVAESAEAIRTAVEGVQKSMMNDPKSVEARTCCASILSVFHEHCDPTTAGVEDYSDQRLLVVVFVITVCGMVKSVIRHLNIRWLPEAGGCILVGVLGYLVLQHMPHVRFAFDGDMFLRIMVPPIVFEAAVKINKQSFRRHVIPITIFAIVGTLASTAFTAFILHKGSSLLRHYVTTIPVKESLIFGALISSIDPIAVLSVLSSMGMTDTDTIYVLIFGESLLNDGVAIVLFQTLVHFLDESLVIDAEVILDASMHFVVVALGSILVGMASGACATLYFSLMHGCQTPMVEVIMFCCWSFVPYYVCDMVEWSGIVAIVANGFIMDLFVIGQKHQHHKTSHSDVDDEVDFLVNGTGASSNTNGKTRPHRQQRCRSIFTYEGHLSPKADSHVHFVIEIFATLMETAIFAYLGLFLFSPRYHWSFYLSLMSIFATVLGRVIMIPLFSHVANIFNQMSLSGQQQPNQLNSNEGVHIDHRMQVVLVFAGLRGAMSFALVEHIPMFDTTTGQGSRLKPELKAMTSASIIFTLFVLGGATSYLLERLGYSVNKQQGQDDVEEVSLLGQIQDKKRSHVALTRKTPQSNDVGLRNNRSVRQRGSR